jgi:hypothetical protein
MKLQYRITGVRAPESEDDMKGNDIKDVFNIVEGKDGKSRWIKIGQAFVNKDGSINAILDVFPRGGKLQIRDRKPATPDTEKGGQL